MKKILLTIGLLTFFISLSFGQGGNSSLGIKYSYRPAGVMPILFSAPSGFEKYKLDTNNPISVAMPKLVNEIKLFQLTNDNGDVLIQYEKIGDYYVTIPSYIFLSDYYKLKIDHIKRQEWNKKIAKEVTKEKKEQGAVFEIGADIAGQRVSLRVNGNITISGKYNNQTQSTRYTSSQEASKSNNFVLDQTQSFNIEGRIGDRISMKVHQDSENSFDFENQLKIYYTGKEDEIVQRVDAGNISLSLPATKFVSGKASNSGLYGIKAFMKLGPVDLTTIVSVEKGQSKEKTWGGGSEGSSIKINDYDYIKDTYFYLDEFYLKQLYPLDGREFKFNSDKIVTDFYLYISCTETEQSAFNAVAYVDPLDTSQYTNETEKLFFRKLKLKDYELKSEMGIVKIQTSFTQEKVLAVAYRTDDGTEVGDVVESMDEYPQKLKLIRHSSPNPQYKTWDLELKNVYNLGARGINEDGFDLKIYYNNGNVRQNGNEKWSSFLQLFGLDNDDDSHSGNPNGQIDIEDNSNVVKLFDGELWLPFTYPFEAASKADDDMNAYYNNELDQDTTLSSSLLYHGDRASITDIQNESKFIIEVTYKNRSDFIQLNDMMIIEGSEEITINGQKLSKGIDYEIDYFAGSVQLISTKAKNPNGELKITYDSQQLFQLDKKTIAGMRAEYKFGNNSFLGGTFMYYNKSSLDDQVRIGEEPFKNYIWDFNGQVSYDLDWMTWAINALPLIRTDSKSSIKIDGEIAQIIPNPNTISNESTGDPNGVAKIDDFEGVKRVTSMGIMYKSWKRASKPANTFFDHTFRERGFLFWFNPYNKIDVRNIWPNKETSNTEDNGINILNIVLDPEVNGITGGETKVDPRQTWGGIMKPLYSGSYNQTKSKYIEIWAKGKTGTVQIDIGKISEDINNNYKLDTEDGCDTLIKKMKNDIIDEKDGRTEDIGINLLTDEEEIALGWDPKIDNFIRDTENSNSSNAEYRYYNGTENNAEETNNYPDTEDLNRNAKVDVLNDYFTYELNLESSPWMISETETENGFKTGWKLYRIPLNKAVDSIGNANLAHVEFMRLSFGNVVRQDTVQIASVAIVGNEWQEIGITDTISSGYHKDDDIFAITVVNTEENAEYDSPEGVQGKLDKINNIRAREQSLCLKLNNLPSGQEAAAEKLLYKDIDLLMYKQLKMYIHGDYNLPSENTPISVSIRLGRIINNNFEYYEVETPVYNGWDKRNEILLDFEKLTTLKMKNEFDGEVYRNPKIGVKEYHLVDKDTGEFTGQIYRIVGNPALSRLKKLIVTVKNNDPFQNYTGDVWLDELRVSDTKNEKGMAIRGQVNMKFADVASLNVNAQKKDAEFHEVNRKDAGSAGDQNDSKSFNISSSFKPSKILPKKWGYSLPVSISYSKSEKSPKYFPYSDIILIDVPDSVKNLSTRRSYSTSISKNTDTDSWLMKNTLEAVKLDFSATNNKRSSFDTKKDKQLNYNGKVSYKLNFEKGDGISFLKWIPIFGKKLEHKKFYWKPNNISLGMNMKESKRDITKRINPDSTTTTHNFDMNRNASINYDPFDNISMKYTRGLHSNLKNYVDDKTKLFTKFTPGYVNTRSESFSTGYTLNLAKWFSPKLNYSTSYSYNKPLDRDYASTSNARKISTNFKLDFIKILDSFKKTGSKNNSSKKSQNATGRYRPQNIKNQDNNKNEENEDGQDIEKKKKVNLGTLLKKVIGKIDPISVTMSETKNINNVGVILYEDSLGHGQTSVNPWYRFGLSETPSDSTSTDKGKYTLGKKVSQNLSLNSGIKITKNLSTSLNFKVDVSNNYSNRNIYKNMTVSYFPLGKKGEEGFPMPNWNVSWNGLESVKFLNKVFKNLSISHAFSGGKQIRIKDTTETGSKYSQNFSPLIQLNMTFKGDIRSNLGFSRNLSIDNGSGDTRQSISENANLSISYSYSGGMNIPIPFMKDLNVTNNITFTVNGSYGKSYQNKYTEVGNDENFNKRNNWKLKTDLNYQFTKNINGSAFFTYGESKLDTGPDRISRDYGLKVNIRISG